MRKINLFVRMQIALLIFLSFTKIAYGFDGVSEEITPQTIEQQEDEIDNSSKCRVNILDIHQNDFRYIFYDRLLQLALSKFDTTDGVCSFNKLPMVSHSRKFQLLSQKKLDVVGNVTSRHSEQEFDFIRIPIHSGLHGVRLLVIRQQDQDRFQKIRTLEDLKRLTAGSVHDWGVTKVLQENGFKVITTTVYESLFRILEKGRIDYFPLAIFEAYQELEKLQSSRLAIDNSLLLYYPSADYFFVGKNNQKLREQLEKCLNISINDGSKDALLEETFGLKKILSHINIESRHLLKLASSSEPRLDTDNDERHWRILDTIIRKTSNKDTRTP